MTEYLNCKVAFKKDHTVLSHAVCAYLLLGYQCSYEFRKISCNSLTDDRILENARNSGIPFSVLLALTYDQFYSYAAPGIFP